MKKLLKSEIMGPINSAHVHYSREKSQQSQLKKKKKNAKHERGKRKMRFSNFALPKRALR